MFRATAFLCFRVDRARYHVARREIHSFRIVTLHETLAVFVSQHAAFAAHRLGDQDSLYARRPNHAGRMKLDELHVHQFGACIKSQGHAVAGVLPGIGGDAPRFADSTRSDYD